MEFVNLVGATRYLFLGAVLSGRHENLLTYAAGVALPIAALPLFLGAKHLSRRQHPVAGVFLAPQHEANAAQAASVSRKEAAATAEFESNKI